MPTMPLLVKIWVIWIGLSFVSGILSLGLANIFDWRTDHWTWQVADFAAANAITAISVAVLSLLVMVVLS